MSNMVGGKDVVFEAAPQGFDVRLVLDAVLELWPDAVFQDVDEEAGRPLTDVLAAGGASTSREFFVYKDEAGAQGWIREGWTEEHGNDMAHFLVSEDATSPNRLLLTLVIDSLTSQTLELMASVQDALKLMSGGEGAQQKLSRVDWEAQLGAAGYTSGRDSFYDTVEELRATLFRSWTADELACHPHEALQFCEVVRRRVVAPVPDHLIMKALMNRRRQGRKNTSSLPQVSIRA